MRAADGYRPDANRGADRLPVDVTGAGRSGLTRRQVLGRAAVLGGGLAMGHLLTACGRAAAGSDGVNIGFVSSDQGGLPARVEMERNCLRLAVDELNAAGGLHGQPVRSMEASGKNVSERAARLLDEQQADVIIGVLSDADRAAAAPQVARLGGLLIDAASQAAAPCQRRLVATGRVPSQQVEPMVDWVVTNVGRRVLVIGAADAWSLSAAEAIRSALRKHNQSPVAVRIVRDNAEIDTAVADSYAINPDVLWSLLQGYDAVRFGTQLGRKGSRALVVASRWDELDAAANPGLLTGALTSQHWFKNLDTADSRDYVTRYQRRFGSTSLLSAPGEAISVAVKIYAAAVGRAGSSNPGDVQRAIPQVEVAAPSGPVRIDAATRVAVGDIYVGRVTASGGIDVHDRLGRPAPASVRCS
ncbi:MAG TPA: transporter substrate-binding protein [Candidatus Dormibacteraeota bacterium]|nr:transporter substrate-binding protein [Candidatus Dormibacteraeota bacterium]